jgi:hypothetical protein
VLSTSGERPHAIPVSTALPAGPRTILLALAHGRESLQRVREDPRVALAVMAPDNVAFTAYGRAHVVEERLEGAERVAAVALTVDGIQDHRQPTFHIDAGVQWRWTEAEAQARDAHVRTGLERLARTFE